jgi:hypothetical protein
MTDTPKHDPLCPCATNDDPLLFCECDIIDRARADEASQSRCHCTSCIVDDECLAEGCQFDRSQAEMRKGLRAQIEATRHQYGVLSAADARLASRVLNHVLALLDGAK